MHTGGILGLLTGMSFLSLFEIMVWLLRLLTAKSKQIQNGIVHKRQSMEVQHQRITVELKNKNVVELKNAKIKNNLKIAKCEKSYHE